MMHALAAVRVYKVTCRCAKDRMLDEWQAKHEQPWWVLILIVNGGLREEGGSRRVSLCASQDDRRGYKPGSSVLKSGGARKAVAA